jgi:hypothetical protein
MEEVKKRASCSKNQRTASFSVAETDRLRAGRFPGSCARDVPIKQRNKEDGCNWIRFMVYI